MKRGCWLGVFAARKGGVRGRRAKLKVGMAISARGDVGAALTTRTGVTQTMYSTTTSCTLIHLRKGEAHGAVEERAGALRAHVLGAQGVCGRTALRRTPHILRNCESGRMTCLCFLDVVGTCGAGRARKGSQQRRGHGVCRGRRTAPSRAVRRPATHRLLVRVGLDARLVTATEQLYLVKVVGRQPAQAPARGEGRAMRSRHR
jgi:hypothetical protein